MSLGLPDTVVHGDLDGNSVVTPDGPVFFDWAAAYWSHPFFDLYELPGFGGPYPSAAEGDERLVPYLAAWDAYAPVATLRQAVLDLEPLCHLPWLLGAGQMVDWLVGVDADVAAVPEHRLAESVRDWQNWLLMCVGHVRRRLGAGRTDLHDDDSVAR